MRRAIEDQDLLGRRHLLVGRPDVRKPKRPAAVGVLLRSDHEGAAGDFLGRAAGAASQDDESLDLPRFRQRARVRGGVSAHAAAHDRDGLRARRTEIPHGGEDVVVKRRTHRVPVSRAVRFAVAAEVDGQHPVTGLGEGARLLRPALLVETGSVREHEAARSCSISVGENDAAVFGPKGHVHRLRRGGGRGLRDEKKRRGDQGAHGTSLFANETTRSTSA